MTLLDVIQFIPPYLSRCSVRNLYNLIYTSKGCEEGVNAFSWLIFSPARHRKSSPSLIISLQQDEIQIIKKEHIPYLLVPICTALNLARNKILINLTDDFLRDITKKNDIALMTLIREMYLEGSLITDLSVLRQELLRSHFDFSFINSFLFTTETSSDCDSRNVERNVERMLNCQDCYISSTVVLVLGMQVYKKKLDDFRSSAAHPVKSSASRRGLGKGIFKKS